MSQNRARWRAIALVLAAVAIAGACASREPVRAEPSVVRLTPRDTRTRVDLVNDGASAVEVENLRIEGNDWTAFTIEAEAAPDRIPAASRVSIDLTVTRRAFREQVVGHGYASYRTGDAQLALVLDRESLIVPLRFEAGRSGSLSSSITALALLGLALLLAARLRDLLLRRISVPPEPAAPTPAMDKAQAAAAAIASGGLAAAFALIPVGDAVCPELLWNVAPVLDLAQCRNGLGGGPLTVAWVGGGLFAWWAAVSLCLGARTLGAAGNGRGDPGATWLAFAVLALAAAPVVISLGSLDSPEPLDSLELGAIVRAQAPSWGVVAHPVAFALAVLALARLSAPRAVHGLHGLMAATIVTLFLGGWTVPFELELAHGGVIVAEAFAFAVKLALVSTLAVRLAPSASLAGERSPRTARHRFGWALLLGLGLLNLCVALAFGLA